MPHANVMKRTPTLAVLRCLTYQCLSVHVLHPLLHFRALFREDHASHARVSVYLTIVCKLVYEC
jgi:hypothetical protein